MSAHVYARTFSSSGFMNNTWQIFLPEIQLWKAVLAFIIGQRSSVPFYE